MDEIIKWSSYEEYEQAFDRAYKSSVDNYILMGYMLRKAQDTDILYNSGYASVAEFAMNRYRIKPDTVSRMMAVNKKFSEGGYSPKLEGKYEGYAATVLAEMLQLPDAVIDALPAGTTREEIRELKAEIREEKKVTPLELGMEGMQEGGWQAEDSFGEFLKEYYRANPEAYIATRPKIIHSTNSTVEKMAEDILCPSGQATMTTRVPGKGRYMMAIKGRGQDVKLVNMRTEETETCTFSHLVGLVIRVCVAGKYGGTPEQAWERLAGEAYEAKPAKETEKPASETGPGDTKKAPVQERKEKTIQKASEPEEETAGSQVNTGEESEDEDDLDRGDTDDAEDDGAGDSTEAGMDNGAGAEAAEEEGQEDDPEPEEDGEDGGGQKIAPAQPEQGDQDSEVEVVESPYRKYLDKANGCLENIRELLEEGDYRIAYYEAVELVTALQEIKNIQYQRNEQLEGQFELEDYDEE